jgi:hypothetical protein
VTIRNARYDSVCRRRVSAAEVRVGHDPEERPVSEHLESPQILACSTGNYRLTDQSPSHPIAGIGPFSAVIFQKGSIEGIP